MGPTVRSLDRDGQAPRGSLAPKSCLPGSLPYEVSSIVTIQQHLQQVMKEFPNLHERIDMFRHNDGRTVNLLRADGNIPIYYQGVEYNIPLTLWLVEAYPRKPPLVYVSPNRDMIIQPRHPYVDAFGMVSWVPYLRQWQYPRSNLVELVQNLSLLFGRDPPLYSRPPADPPSLPPPAWTPFQGINPVPGPYANSSQTIPYPPYASSQQHQQQHQQQNQQQHQQQNQQQQQQQHQQQQQQQHQQQQQQQHQQQQQQQHQQQQQQQQQQHQQHQQQQQKQKQAALPQDPGEVQRRAVSWITARLERDSEELIHEREREMENLCNMQSVLTSRAVEIDRGVRELQQEKEGLEAQLQVLLTNTDVQESWLKQNGRGLEAIHIDQLLEPADALSRQLLECTAADFAVDDILYSLDRAAQEGAIPVDQYLKHVRSLAREQFFYRATCFKVKQSQVSHQVEAMAARANQQLCL